MIDLHRPAAAGSIALLFAAAAAAQEEGGAPKPDVPPFMEHLATADTDGVWSSDALHGRKVTLEGWTRNGYVVPAGGAREFTLHVEKETKVELGFALVADEGAPQPPPTTFVVETSGADGGAPRFSWQIELDASSRWVVRSLELGTLAGRDVTLAIRARPIEPAPDPFRAPPPPAAGFTALASEPVVLAPATSPRWNVVLISLDTLRADHLSCYGYGRRTSPNLDALAAEGVRFAWDISTAPWTVPSHMSMLTGLYPSSHHVNGSFDQFCNHADPGALYRTLDRATPTLAERLRSAGWRTYALTAGACVDAWLGFDHGFDSFHVGPYKLDPSVPAEVGEFLGRHAAIPFFLFLHTYEVHEPYLEVERGRKWLAPKDGDAVAQLLLGHSEGEVGSDGEMLARAGLARADVIPAFYDAGIETADALVGHVVERLKELGLFDRTLLVVTADHGQEFADHDPGEIFGRHGLTLYDELIHVPLVMHVPDATVHGGVVDGIVQSVDLVPTILELLGLPPAADVQGTSLAGLAREGGTSPREFAWSESTESGQEWKSLRTRSHKLIAGFELPTLERSGIPGPPAWEHLFDLAADPKEQNDLVESEARLAQRLHDRLLAGFLEITRPIGDATPGQPLDPDVVERLRKLGYLR